MSLFKTIHTLHFDTMDSTHAWGKKNIHLLDMEALTCITATKQTAGYGRHNRKWASPPGVNLYATLCFTIPNSSTFISNLGQILSLSIVSLLEKNGFTPEIKWPNDIRVHTKKLAGILCESVLLDDKMGIILSLGLNINMPQELLDQIDQPATSFLQLSGYSWNIDEILKDLLQQFTSDLEILHTEGFPAFHEKYEQILAFKGQTIRCFDGKKTIEGVCHAVLPDGRLELLLSNGEKIRLSTGDISLHY